MVVNDDRGLRELYAEASKMAGLTQHKSKAFLSVTTTTSVLQIKIRPQIIWIYLYSITDSFLEMHGMMAEMLKG